MAAKFDLIVIGGGAGGGRPGGWAAQRGRSVLLLEKNRKLGQKLAITGGGRCNITNAQYDRYKLLANYGLAKDFLHSAFAKFGVEDTTNFFKQRGLSLKVDAN